MSTQDEKPDVWSYLRSVVELSRQVSGGKAASNGEQVAPEFLAAAPGMLRALAESVGTVYDQHQPGADGMCRVCSERSPCTTRRNLVRPLLHTEP